jgi:hypothetical protein
VFLTIELADFENQKIELTPDAQLKFQYVIDIYLPHFNNICLELTHTDRPMDLNLLYLKVSLLKKANGTSREETLF